MLFVPVEARECRYLTLRPETRKAGCWPNDHVRNRLGGQCYFREQEGLETGRPDHYRYFFGGCVIEPEDLKPGAVVCDVPHDVSAAAQMRMMFWSSKGLGGSAGRMDHFNFGYPPGLVLACMAETMLLALKAI